MLDFLRSLWEKKNDSDAVWRALVDASRATAAGITVTPSKALESPAVHAAVRVRSETIGGLPVHLYRRSRGGGKERASDHPLQRLLHDRPNPWTSAAELNTQLERDAILEGKAFARATRVGEKVIELHRLDPKSVEVKTDTKTLEPYYLVTLSGGGTSTLAWQDVLDVSPVDRESPIRQCANAVALLLTLEEHGAKFFRNGARPSGILSHPKSLNDDVVSRLKAGMEEFRTSKSYSTLVVEEGMRFETVAFSSVDAQFLELREFQLGEISRVLAVPPVFLSDFGRATWGNSESMMALLKQFTILPRVKIWEGAIARLFSPHEQRTHFAEFLLDGLERADLAARYTSYAQAVTNGLLSPNEIRSLENRPPYEGGDTYRLPLNTEDAAGSDSKVKKRRTTA